MTTFYLDLEGGNDANDGLSFANRWKTLTNGPTAARTAPGDTIRVMASPDPTSLGTCTFTQGPPPAAKNIVSSTNATPIVLTVTAHGYATGDIVRVASHTTNTNANGVWKVGTTTADTFQLLKCDGSNTTGNGAGPSAGTVTNINSLAVLLPSAVTSPIAVNGGRGQKTNWTASANVTCLVDEITSKEGYCNQAIIIAAGFTTGKAAYWATGTLDLSGYQQITFWLKQTTGTIGAAGAVQLKLCSDTTGDTPVNTFDIPDLGAASGTRWVPITIDLGTNLGSSIQSIAFYVATDNGAQTFVLDNIQAVKAASANDSLNLASLISKDSTGPWYPIQSINSNVVILGGDASLAVTDAKLRGYALTGGSATGYKREGIRLPMIASGAAQTINEGGTLSATTNYEFGWDRTAMTTQSGDTWVDMVNSAGNFFANNQNYVSFNKLGVIRTLGGLNSSGTNVSFGNVYSASGPGAGISITGTRTSVVRAVSVGAGGAGFSSSAGALWVTTGVESYNSGTNGITFSGDDLLIENVTVSGSTTIGVSLSGSATTIRSGSITNSGSYGLQGSSGTRATISRAAFSGNTTAAVNAATSSLIVLSDCTVSEPVEAAVSSFGSAILSNRHDDTDNNHWQWFLAGTINYQTAVTDSPATGSWKISPTHIVNCEANLPLKLKLGTVVVGASALVTVTARMRRSHGSYTTIALVCPGGQIPGVASDVSSSITAAADTWETVSITFTPTKAGAVDIYAYAYGGSTHSNYVCNLTASQA